MFDLLYCNFYFIAMVWIQIHNISKMCLYLEGQRLSELIGKTRANYMLSTGNTLYIQRYQEVHSKRMDKDLPRTGTLEVPSLVALEITQPWAYIWSSRLPEVNVILFLNLAS